jgi:hypothetical protein
MQKRLTRTERKAVVNARNARQAPTKKGWEEHGHQRPDRHAEQDYSDYE